MRPLEEELPPLEQSLELLARAAVSREHVDVVPVLCKALLELGDRALAGGDLRLDALELRGSLWLDRRLARLGRGLSLDRGRRRRLPCLPLPDVFQFTVFVLFWLLPTVARQLQPRLAL